MLFIDRTVSDQKWLDLLFETLILSEKQVKRGGRVRWKKNTWNEVKKDLHFIITEFEWQIKRKEEWQTVNKWNMINDFSFFAKFLQIFGLISRWGRGWYYEGNVYLIENVIKARFFDCKSRLKNGMVYGSWKTFAMFEKAVIKLVIV